MSKVSAQTNVDSIFSGAIDFSKNQQLTESLKEAKKAEHADSKRADILVFIANLYSWQNKNDSALIYISKAQQLNDHQAEFYEAWTNILLRSKQYDALLKACDEAEQYKYSSEDVLKKRVYAYAGLNQYNQAVELIEKPENKRFQNTEPFNSLYADLLLKRNTNIISAYYILDLIDNIAPQHLASLGYSFKTGQNTSLGFRGNYANRFGLSDFQLEADFYWSLLNHNYMYFNYGYGFNFNSTLFPRHRAGLEYYIPLKPAMEVSLGGRYLDYLNNQVGIFTGHFEKYFSKNWFSIRPFYVYSFTKKVQSLSLLGNYRLYGKNDLDYWGLELGYGNSPDDTYSNLQNGGFNQLTAYRAKIEKNFMLDKVSDIHIAFGYTREEFQLNIFRNKYTIELGYKLRLK
jgi:YaiO family outer membrane protein